MSTDSTPPIPTFDVEGVASYILDGKAKNIVVMCGAGISVAAGIPDFRTPGTGLYAQVARYNLPSPESLFTLSYLREHPEAFYSISNAMNLWPGTFAPTRVHHFIKLLDERNLLLQCCTQNIDCLERSAGLPSNKVLEAHGSFAGAACIDCRVSFDMQRLRAIADDGAVPRCEACGGIVKPNVVFFGESLPVKFLSFLSFGMRKADLLLVVGTSLKVYPFAGLVDEVGADVPRILINNERVGRSMFFKCDETLKPEATNNRVPEDASDSDSGGEEARIAEAASGRKATRDTLLLGDCQDIIVQLATALGFAEELERRYKEGVDSVAASGSAGSAAETASESKM